MKIYDVVVIGSGAAGIMAAITAARDDKSVLVLEKMPKIGMKLKATGGGKCNITNTLDINEFINSFGKQGRFMRDALHKFNQGDLVEFLSKIGLQTHAPDGFRVFPISHNSQSVLDILISEMKRVSVEVKCEQNVQDVKQNDLYIFDIHTNSDNFKSKNLIIATGGLGYSTLGATGDGYGFAKSLGHSVSDLYPAMIPLRVEEKWVQNCTADTIAKAILKIDLPKMKKIKKTGDLIFTKNGIRGPVVLDFSREITPLLHKYKKIPLQISLTKGKNEEEIRVFLKNEAHQNPHDSIVNVASKLVPKSVCIEFCKIINIDIELKYSQIGGVKRDKLIKLLVWTPLSVIGHDGFFKAMITRGGVKLKEINPKTMQSKIVKKLYFCGEVVDLDGPCGGYNLQWSFSSGYLSGCLKD
ncbi:MAG: NAD(P)/FAD-dependent oxidoreductase [Epsilonproteobacteria bacterium]|nr:NAD(P)/FAD-dependent oxidoreductase [Campylobacterota bacterium]